MFCLVVLTKSRWAVNEDRKYWITWEVGTWRSRERKETNWKDKRQIILGGKYLCIFIVYGETALGMGETRNLFSIETFYSKGLPVIFDRISSSLAAEGPRAMVWMIAPLRLTSSKHELIPLSCPSVSNMISEPDVLWLLLVIA